MKKYLWIYTLSFYLRREHRVIYPGLVKDISLTDFFNGEYEDIPILIINCGLSYFILSDRPLKTFHTPRTRPRYINKDNCLVLDTQILLEEGEADYLRISSYTRNTMNKAFIKSFLSGRESTINLFLNLVFSNRFKLVWKTSNYNYSEAIKTGKY